MTANPWSSVASGLGSSLTFIIKLCEYTYALRAVDQQTKDYLITAQHAWENIKICRRLFASRKDQLPATESKDYERVINEAKWAAEAVARLLEPARVDMDADAKIHFSTRVLWVLRDNADISAALRRLDIVHTTLTQNIATLRLMRPCDMEMFEPTRTTSREKPPSYKDSQLLYWKRQTRLTPQPSMETLRPPSSRPQTPRPATASTASSPNANLAGRWQDSGVQDPPEYPLDDPPAQPEQRHVSWPLDAKARANTSTAETAPIPAETEQTSVSTRQEPRPRSWLEYQAAKASQMRQTQQGGHYA